MCPNCREYVQYGAPAFAVHHWAANGIGDGWLPLIEHFLTIHPDLLRANHSALPGTP